MMHGQKNIKSRKQSYTTNADSDILQSTKNF